MKPKTLSPLVFWLVAITLPIAAESICDYRPPESRISDLGVQGSFSWYDGPYADDRERSVSAGLVADCSLLHSSVSSARTFDGRVEVDGTRVGWTADAGGSGSLRSFLADDLFVVAAVGFVRSSASPLEFDLTGGVGTGRFRDVTPMAQAIRIQNELLDLGELLAPVGDTALLDVAQILGEVGPSDDDKAVRLAERLAATELVVGEGLGVRALLSLDEILASYSDTRFCGRDVQARVGASATFDSEVQLAATGILLARYAAVPDPVSQVDSSIQAKFRLANPDEMAIDADLSYARRLPDGWTARAEYRVSLDRSWTATDSTIVSHAVAGSFTTQVFGSVGIRFACNAEHRTGDEEITVSLTVDLEADLF